MLNAGLMIVGTFTFTRIIIRKFDINNKTVISIIVSLSVTGLLYLIQFILKSILDLIF